MHFYIMTLFPEMVMQGLGTSIIGRAMEKGILSIDAVNIRDYAFNKHNSVDDYPYGGGAGMLMQAEPVYQAYQAVEAKIAAGKKEDGDDSSVPIGRRQSGRSPGSSILRPRGRHLPREWQRNLPKKRNWCSCAGITRGSMSGCWKRS